MRVPKSNPTPPPLSPQPQIPPPPIHPPPHPLSSPPQELYLRNPAAFNIPQGQPITFAELAETVRATRQTALGIIRGGKVAVLAPHATHVLSFASDDRVVVIAEEF